jgi:TonB family protein
MPDWKNCEGQLLDGKYPLERHVSGDEACALFLIGFASAAVRIRRADAKQAASLVQHWNRVKLLRHSHLLEIDAAGVSVMAGEPVAYLVMEHAEENLAEILRDRPLTTDETREMLLQVASALDYLHSQGMTHGDLNASNIMAIGDTVKLSSESIAEGDATTDMRALGFTLIHALTQREQTLAHDDVEPTVDLSAPFGEIAKSCLNPDPALRWTANEIVARLRSPEHAGSSRPTSPPPTGKPVTARPRLRRLAGPASLVAAGVAVVAGVVMRRTDAPSPAAVEPRLPPAAVAPGPAPAATTPAPKTVAPVRSNEKAQSTRDRLGIENGVTRRVTPNIPEKVRNTIQGKPAVVVRATVDPTGDVAEAVVERSFSPYFSRFALQAARQWKFIPEEGASPREWILRFEFTQTNTRVVAQRADRE